MQYVNWIGGLAHGDLGYSYVSEKPALEEIAPRIPITAKLAGLALAFSVLFGVPLGVISAVRQNTPLDYVLRVVSLSGLSMPSFWLGLLILMAFVALVRHDPDLHRSADRLLERRCWLYSVPAAAVGFRSSALVMRLTRSSMLEVLRQDYIRTARAKGASDRNVNYHHALRNALLPVVTVIGIEAAFLMGGLIVTETVFNIPGVARFLVEAIRWRDYPIVQNLVMFIAVVVVSINFLIDMLYAVLDPRIRYAELSAWRVIDHHPGTATAEHRPRRKRMVEAAPSRRVASARRGRRGHHAGVRVRRDLRRSASPAYRSDRRPIRAISLLPPGDGHVLGADSMGRDIYSRIVYGARISLAVGIGSTVLGCVFGVALGLASGYIGGWVDLIIQRMVDMLQALPLLVLALVMAASLGPVARQHHRRHRHPAHSLYARASSAPTRWRCASSPSSRPRAPSA